ncbi:Uncharacterised protein [Salmonella enterica subsp. enterica serovar Bovismorbificans]|uniref:Uncharacterized protein n=1 Tax=Salmonella enterica subsp. enterica serovar Bovismorbificans TaxID=58097 RepID=A0A655CD80_SALET|nr:Uncharacterised protein [Salmonella enterica subsp. enterica serovar Bovismorbificans]
MVGFDVGDDRNHRLQMQEGCVALICLGNQVTTMAQTRMNACGFHQSAIHESRVQPRFGINTGHHRGRCGFSVRPGNGDAVAKTHQFRQHFRTANNRNTRFMRRDNFRVIRGNCAGNDDHAGITHIFRTMVKENRRPQARQLLGHRIRR